MNHFVYAMRSTDPAPAAGGDTKSWFEYYKWDVDGLAFVPVAEEKLEGYVPHSADLIWFVMDDKLLGCCRVHTIMPSLSGAVELHYDTRLMQEAPVPLALDNVTWTTGFSTDKKLLDGLKQSFDATCPPRDEELASSLGLRQSNDPKVEAGST